jgi:hypothetical protein
MSSFHVAFDRAFLKSVMETVSDHAARAEIKKAWVYHFMGNHWEFHGPDGFYWHGSAGSAYGARAAGWESWLRFKGFEIDDEEASS